MITNRFALEFFIIEKVKIAGLTIDIACPIFSLKSSYLLMSKTF
ncbi:MAG TPA: hypothetical protein VIM70_06855 [Clostridium sp.]